MSFSKEQSISCSVATRITFISQSFLVLKYQIVPINNAQEHAAHHLSLTISKHSAVAAVKINL